MGIKWPLSHLRTLNYPGEGVGWGNPKPFCVIEFSMGKWSTSSAHWGREESGGGFLDWALSVNFCYLVVVTAPMSKTADHLGETQAVAPPLPPGYQSLWGVIVKMVPSCPKYATSQEHLVGQCVIQDTEPHGPVLLICTNTTFSLVIKGKENTILSFKVFFC